MPVIYTIRDTYLGEKNAFPTLSEARAFRKRNYNRGERPEIVKETLADLPMRKLLCALYNRMQYRVAYDVVVAADEAAQ